MLSDLLEKYLNIWMPMFFWKAYFLDMQSCWLSKMYFKSKKYQQ